MRGEERRRHAVAPLSVMAVEDKRKIALCSEKKTNQEEALMVDREVSMEMPCRNVKGLLPLPTTQTEIERSPFWKAFENSQVVELSGLFDVGCFKVIGIKGVPRGRKIVVSRWVHSYKSDDLVNYVKTESRYCIGRERYLCRLLSELKARFPVKHQGRLKI